jgi:hypothetical protein
MTKPDSLTPMPESADALPRGDLPDRLAAAERTVWRLTYVDFPWDVEKSLQFALLRTYAVPAISALLVRTGEFEHRTAKRYDDTALLIYEVMRSGLASERARRAFGRINGMHGRFRISGEDFLYVLSTFTFSPIDWLESYARRAMTAAEKEDWFVYWNAFGERMGIDGLYGTSEAFRAFALDYERRNYVPVPSNRLIAERTIDLVLGDYHAPKFLHSTLRPLALAICEPHLVKALGFDEPAPWLRRLAGGGLGLRRAILGRLSPNRAPKWRALGRRSYPEGYNIDELGTFPRRAAGDG